MQALGLIETRGLIAAIESADAMLKAAEVTLLEKTIVGGGLVTIVVSGDVGAVKAAIDAGEAAVQNINSALLISKHVIPRPHQDIDCLIKESTSEQESTPDATPDDKVEDTNVEESNVEVTNEVIEEISITEKASTNDVSDYKKEDIDKMVEEFGLEYTMDVLNKLAVVKLRRLAREYQTLGIVGRQISKADKEQLITKFRKFYQ